MTSGEDQRRIASSGRRRQVSFFNKTRTALVRQTAKSYHYYLTNSLMLTMASTANTKAWLSTLMRASAKSHGLRRTIASSSNINQHFLLLPPQQYATLPSMRSFSSSAAFDVEDTVAPPKRRRTLVTKDPILLVRLPFVRRDNE
jgi:hypothetical protein